MIEKFLKKKKVPSYKQKQFNELFYKHAISSFDELTTWSEELRSELRDEIPFSTLKEIRTEQSKNGNTTKVLFHTKDSFPVETVLMKYRDGRNSLCISCMSGCPVGCTFCATGQMGFNKNLSSREIIDQVLYFKRLLKKDGKKITNIIFMGMGEPMLNLKEVEKSIDVLTNEDKLALSPRRIVVSTVGYVPQMKEFLLDHGYMGKLAVSLHTPNQRLRERLMPIVAKENSLDELFYILDEYVLKRNKRVTFEYLLLKDINDGEDNARELVELLRDRLCLVNLINFNPSPNLPYKETTQERVDRFVQILESNGINVTLRYSQGNDIQAACGQLASDSKV